MTAFSTKAPDVSLKGPAAADAWPGAPPTTPDSEAGWQAATLSSRAPASRHFRSLVPLVIRGLRMGFGGRISAVASRPQRTFSKSRISAKRSSSFVGCGSAGSSGTASSFFMRLKLRTTMKSAKATMRNEMIELMKSP